MIVVSNFYTFAYELWAVNECWKAITSSPVEKKKYQAEEN